MTLTRDLHQRINRRGEIASGREDTLAYKLHVIQGLRWREARRLAEKIVRKEKKS